MTIPTTDKLTNFVPGRGCPAWCVECQDTTPLGGTDIGGHSSRTAFGAVRLTRSDQMDLGPDGTTSLTRGDVVVFLPGDDDREFTVAEAARILVDLRDALEAITADGEPSQLAELPSNKPRSSRAPEQTPGEASTIEAQRAGPDRPTSWPSSRPWPR